MEPNLSYAECPNCYKKASGKTKVNEIFGFRRFKGHLYVQSHCKECRKAEQKDRQRKGIEQPRS